MGLKNRFLIFGWGLDMLGMGRNFQKNGRCPYFPGINNHKLTKYIAEVFVDVEEMSNVKT
jgi:hypothetical protein